jgi:hypothetical protein
MFPCINFGRLADRPQTWTDSGLLGFVKKPADATTWQNLVDLGGLIHDPGKLGQDLVFFFSNVVFILRPPILFHHFLYNELLLAAAERKGE